MREIGLVTRRRRLMLAQARPGFRSWWSRVSRHSWVELGKRRQGRVGAGVYAVPACSDLVHVGSKAVIRAGGWTESAW